MEIKTYKELIVWQRSIELVVVVYEVTRQYPREEMYGLTSQTRRAATSIPANIAEGWTRQHTPEFIQFLHTALGSGSELETHVIVGNKLGFLSDANLARVMALQVEVMKMLNTMIAKMKHNRLSVYPLAAIR